MARKCWLIIFTIFFALPVFASESSYFEFNPDDYESGFLNVIESDTPSEIFIPQNDYLNGIDIFIDNSGPAGEAVFTLLGNDQVIISKTIRIPTINKTAGGQRFHINFNQIIINKNLRYSYRINSQMPDLRLFYSNRINYLSHNASFTSQYLNGAAKIGNEEMNYSFKFALYEGLETKPPVVDNIKIEIISENKIKFSFNADEPVDYNIRYGLGDLTEQVGFFNEFKYCGIGLNPCEIVISVIPDRIYNYALTIRDIWGNFTQTTGTFASFGRPDITPIISPLISGSDVTPPIIDNVKISSITDRSVAFSWQTNEVANSYFLISYSTNMLSITAGNDTTYELLHFLQSDPILNPDTPYIATIVSRDMADNETRKVFGFTTAPAGTIETPAPTPTITQTPTPPTSVSPSPSSTSTPSATPSTSPTSQSDKLLPLSMSSDFSDGTVTLNWQAPTMGEPSDGYRIDIFDSTGKLISTKNVKSGTHQITVPSVSVDTTTIVYANNDGIYQKISKPAKYNSAAKKSFWENLLTLLPYILGGFVIVIFSIVLILKFVKNKKNQPPPANSGTDSYSSAQSIRT
jgi:hypothetical protein